MMGFQFYFPYHESDMAYNLSAGLFLCFWPITGIVTVFLIC